MSRSIESKTCEYLFNEETGQVDEQTNESVGDADEVTSSADSAEETQKIPRDKLEELLSKCSCL